VNGSLAAASPVTVAPAGKLAGNGSVGSLVAVRGAIAPGTDSVGTLTTGPAHLFPGSVLDFRVASADPINVAARDFININGTLYLDALTNGTTTIKLRSMLTSNTPGNVPDFNPANNYVWTVGTATGLSLGSASLSSIQLDSTGFGNPHSGTFSLQANLAANALEIHYTAPGSTLVPPSLSGYGPRSGSSFPLTFSGPSGQTYKVLVSTNVGLPVANWTVLSSGTFGGSAVNYADTTATNAQKFYRITSP
jgi:hypothetical protein